NDELTSFRFVPNYALESHRRPRLARSQTFRLGDSPHAGTDAHVGHVLQREYSVYP
ncbi:hypothetical protein WN51_08557, partial [Melipona quadrifasciata]